MKIPLPLWVPASALLFLGCSSGHEGEPGGDGGGAGGTWAAGSGGQIGSGGAAAGGFTSGGSTSDASGGSIGAAPPSGGSFSTGGDAFTSGGTGSGGLPSGGAESSGGASGGQGSTGGASSDGFSLLFRDDFDALDSNRWQLMTHSWSNNLAKFSSESVSVAGGFMTLTLLDAPDGLIDGGEPKQFLGAEVRSVDTITYGRVRVRAKLASGSAVVSALVTIYTPWPADNWNELDIECLGADPSEVQYNAMVYTGTLPAPSTPVSPTQHPEIKALGFDGSADFHTYDIEWTPTAAIFRADGMVQRTWTDRIELMTLPQNILLTIWASGAPDWAGAVDSSTLGASAVYDWIEVYEYSGN